MAYLGKTPSQATRRRYYKTASGSETSLSGTMTTGGTLTFSDGEFVDVSVNGVALVAGTDYNTTTANTIGGLSALSANDQVEIIVYDTFSVFGGNVNGDFTISNGTLTASSNVDFNGDLDVDGTTNLDVVDIDGAVDMASTLQVDGAITSSSGATITTADNNPQLTLTSTDTDSGHGPRLNMVRNPGEAGADGDNLGQIFIQGYNDAGTPELIDYFQLFTEIADASDGTEDARQIHYVMTGGSQRSRIEHNATETVINEDSIDVDFRVEGNTTAKLLFVDAGNERVEINSASPELHLIDTTNNTDAIIRSNNNGDIVLEADENNERDGTIIRFDLDGSEVSRFIGANFLVGKTASGSFDQSSVELNNTGYIMSARDDGGNLFLSRQGSSAPEGAMIALYKVNSEIVRIGVKSDRMYMGSSSTGLAFEGNQADSIYPASPSADGLVRDNYIDLGYASGRFDDVFATNGTIQTSDENEKQDIVSLTSAEITAAKAISKLFKTFKWKDKVVAKGDAARTHTGVVAQEVQKAMSDAGLDAAKYAFWCSDTWWEVEETTTDDDGKKHTGMVSYQTEKDAPEGATKRTRLGVRYPELLAFIGAATEQRLADIENRLTALES
jgi:hypothetical protein